MMIFFAGLLFPILCIVKMGSAHPFTDGCDTGIIQRCPTSWIVAYLEADIILPPGAFLDEHCDSVLEFVHCVHDFYLSCPKIENSALTYGNYDGMVDSLLKLCDKSSQMRAEYEPFVPCLNNKENGFRDIIGKVFTNIKDHVVIRTNYFQVELTEEQRKEIACISLTTDVPQFLEAFFGKCGDLINVTFDDTAAVYSKAIELVCPTAAAIDMRVTQTAPTEEPYLIATTQKYYGIVTTADSFVYNVSEEPISTPGVPCSMEWIHDFRQLNFSDVQSENLGNICRDLESFTDCVRNTSDKMLSDIVRLHRISPAVFITSFTKLEGLCENRHVPEPLETATYVYNVTEDTSTTEDKPCAMDWLQNFRQLNSSDIHSDLLNKVCIDFGSFADCTGNKTDMEFDEIVRLSGVPSENFMSSYIELIRICEDRRYATENLTTDAAKHNETNWNTYNCSDDPVLPHQMRWITEQLSGSLIPYPKVLQDNCPKLITGIQWLLHYKVKCSTRYPSVDEDAPNPYRNYTELLPIFEQLCNNETSLWKDYEKYSPCIKREEGFIKSTIDIAKADLMSFTIYVSKQNNSYVEVGAAQARVCIIRAVYMPLVLDVIQDQCGTDSAEFSKRFMDNFFHPVESYCPNGLPFLHKMVHMYVTYRLQALDDVPPRIPPW